MTLEVEIRLRRESFRLEAALQVEAGEVVAVLGPNGAGKTTLLRAVAGLEQFEAGRVTLNGRVLSDPVAGVDVAPAERRVGMVFQDYRLFPHLSVRDNVAFGRDAAGRAAGWLDRLELDPLAARYPGELSGGEAQRVALARVLATEPRALLLDEPLAALDVASRHRIRTELGHHLASVEVPVLLVTHDPLDAALLAGRLLILEDGTVSQTGTLSDITRRPRTEWVARLAGVNLFRGRAEHGVVRLGDAELVAADDAEGEVFAVIPPQAVSLYRRPPEGSPRNVWEGTVTSLEPAGSRIRVAVGGELPIVAEITPGAVDALSLGDKGPVWVVVKASEVSVYPA